MCEAIAVAAGHVFDWVAQHNDSFPHGAQRPAAQVDLAPGARGFVFGAGIKALVKFLSIGTRLNIAD